MIRIVLIEGVLRKNAIALQMKTKALRVLDAGLSASP
jgi:hypothetical protein